MGKRGPKKGQGGRPRGGKHTAEQREEWRLRRLNAKHKKWNSFWYGYASFQGYR